MNGNSHTIGYIKGLDILRFMAAACVTMHHISYELVDKLSVKTAFLSHHINSGSFFVDLFFVISGFLISSILFKEIDTNRFNIKKFFLRRILRIWPLYFFVLIVYGFIVPLVMKTDTMPEILKNLFFASLFITNFQAMFFTFSKSTLVILWSVGIEEQIYFFIPFLMLAFKNKKLIFVLLLIIVGFLSWTLIPFTINPGTGLLIRYFFPTSYLYYFGTGGLIAFLIQYPIKTINKMDSVLLNPVFQITVLLFGFAYVFSFIDYTALPKYFALAFDPVFSAYLVYCAVKGKLYIDLLSDKITRFLGNISYSMYLIHGIIISFLMMVFSKKGYTAIYYTKHDIMFTVYVLALTVLTSILFYKFIEKPFLKLKNKYTFIQNK